VPHALGRKLGPELAVGERPVDERRRHPAEEIELAVREREPDGLSSSMTEIWTRPASGSRLPSSAAAMGCASAGTGPAGT